jgi:dTDP-4-dehydrorhamnose reductase
MMLKLAAEKPELEVVDAEASSPTYTPDLAQATRDLLVRQPFGIYHLTNSGACTWPEWAKKIVALAGFKTEVKPVSAARFSRPAPRPAYSILLNTKLPPLRGWQEALEEYLIRR